MSAAQKAQLEAELTQAVLEALYKVGLGNFKATSLFGSAGVRQAARKAA